VPCPSGVHRCTIESGLCDGYDHCGDNSDEDAQICQANGKSLYLPQNTQQHRLIMNVDANAISVAPHFSDPLGGVIISRISGPCINRFYLLFSFSFR